jgi:hypothetical protein
MKKYLVFMFCLIFAASFVACGARQPQGRPGVSQESSSEPTPPLSSPSPDGPLNKLDNGDKITLLEYANTDKDKLKLVFKLERGEFSKEVSVEEVGVAGDFTPEELERVLKKVWDINDGGEVFIAAGIVNINEIVIALYVFDSGDNNHSCSIGAVTYMRDIYLEYWLKNTYILEKKGKFNDIERKYTLICM